MALLHGDRGDIVLGWLTKLTVTLAVFGVLLFDAVSLGSGVFRAEESAQQAARAAAQDFQRSKDIQQAYDAAVAEVQDDGDVVDAPTFRVDAEGGVTLTLTREVPTLVLEKVPPLRDYATLSRTVSVGPPA